MQPSSRSPNLIMEKRELDFFRRPLSSLPFRYLFLIASKSEYDMMACGECQLDFKPEYPNHLITEEDKWN